MKRKTKTELQRAKIAKTTRTLVRLRHSLAADEELNQILPDTLDEFDHEIAAGRHSGIDAEAAAKLLLEGI